MFEVRAASKTEGTPTMAWKPTDDDKYVCGKKEALCRWVILLEMGNQGTVVDGFVPGIVEVVHRKTGQLMLGGTTEPGDVPHGPWASSALPA